MIELNAVNLVFWAGVAGYMSKGAWASITGRSVRYGDPMRLACFTTAVLFFAFNLRSIAAPDNQSIRMVLSALSAADAVLIWRLGVAYGRGPLLKNG